MGAPLIGKARPPPEEPREKRKPVCRRGETVDLLHPVTVLEQQATKLEHSTGLDVGLQRIFEEANTKNPRQNSVEPLKSHVQHYMSRSLRGG